MVSLTSVNKYFLTVLGSSSVFVSSLLDLVSVSAYPLVYFFSSAFSEVSESDFYSDLDSDLDYSDLPEDSVSVLAEDPSEVSPEDSDLPSLELDDSDLFSDDSLDYSEDLPEPTAEVSLDDSEDSSDFPEVSDFVFSEDSLDFESEPSEDFSDDDSLDDPLEDSPDYLASLFS